MYRKFKADQIFTGLEMIDGDNVLIMREGACVEIVPFNQAGDDIEILSGILIPGLVNGHCHLELSHMKGKILPGLGLVDFVSKIMKQRYSEEDDIRTAIQVMEEKMIARGIVAIGDICNNSSTLSQKTHALISYHNFIEVSGWVPEVSDLRFSRSMALYDEFRNNGLIASLVPHAPYSVSDKLWELMLPYFKNAVVSIHNQESPFEDDLFLNGTGGFIGLYKSLKMDNVFFKPTKKSSLQSYFPKLATARSVILVHNTFTQKEDIEFVQSHNAHQLVSYCICINANLYIEEQVPPIALLLEKGCHIILGTDSIASNHNLDIVEEMKTIQAHYPAIALEQMLPWATLNGAKALGFEDTLGSFGKGKRPGVVLLENIEFGKLTPQSLSRRIL